MDNKNTEDLSNVLNRIYEKESIVEYIRNSLSNTDNMNFSQFLNDVCKKRGLVKSDVIKNADIDRVYGYQIFNGTRKPSRDNILKLCISLKLDLKDIDRALTISEEGKLYPKKIRDSIIIFAINNKLTVMETNFLLDEQEQKILGE